MMLAAGGLGRKRHLLDRARSCRCRDAGRMTPAGINSAVLAVMPT